MDKELKIAVFTMDRQVTGIAKSPKPEAAERNVISFPLNDNSLISIFQSKVVKQFRIRYFITSALVFCSLAVVIFGLYWKRAPVATSLDVVQGTVTISSLDVARATTPSNLDVVRGTITPSSLNVVRTITAPRVQVVMRKEAMAGVHSPRPGSDTEVGIFVPVTVTVVSTVTKLATIIPSTVTETMIVTSTVFIK